MDKMNRREWLARVGSFTLGSLVMSSCQPSVKSELLVPSENGGVAGPLTLEIVNCRQCDACMPCPYGVDITGNFSVFNRALRNKRLLSSSDAPDFYEQGLKFLAEYESKLSEKTRSHHCIDCGECLSACRHGVKISKELEKITALTDRLRDYRSII